MLDVFATCLCFLLCKWWQLRSDGMLLPAGDACWPRERRRAKGKPAGASGAGRKQRQEGAACCYVLMQMS